MNKYLISFGIFLVKKQWFCNGIVTFSMSFKWENWHIQLLVKIKWSEINQSENEACEREKKHEYKVTIHDK